MNSILLEMGWTDNIVYGNLETVETARCYFTKHTPETLDWSTTYKEDISTARMLLKINGSQQTEWTPVDLKDIHKGYRQHLQANRIQLLHGKLVLMKPIFKTFSRWDLSLFLKPSVTNCLLITTVDQQEATWENIKPYSVSVYDSFGPVCGMPSKNGSRDVHSVSNPMVCRMTSKNGSRDVHSVSNPISGEISAMSCISHCR